VIPSLQLGHNYNVRVRAYVYNTWGNWGANCTIGIASSGISAREFSIVLDEDDNEILIEKEVIMDVELSLNAYPNPFESKGGFTVNSSDDQVQVYLYDALGNIVWNEQVKTNNYIEFETEQFPSGVYLLTAINKKGISSSLRLIKIK
jgi:hypothetical protein